MPLDKLLTKEVSTMRLIERTARYEIWYFPADDEYAVYGVYASGDPRTCPSLGMAREVAAGL